MLLGLPCAPKDARVPANEFIVVDLHKPGADSPLRRYQSTSPAAVHSQIERREIARSLLDLELAPDRPNVLLL